MDRNIDNNVDNNIIQTEYSELMQKSYIDYAMSVIIARALDRKSTRLTSSHSH